MLIGMLNWGIRLGKIDTDVVLSIFLLIEQEFTTVTSLLGRSSV
jgi:hypothetical protein